MKAMTTVIGVAGLGITIFVLRDLSSRTSRPFVSPVSLIGPNGTASPGISGSRPKIEFGTPDDGDVRLGCIYFSDPDAGPKRFSDRCNQDDVKRANQAWEKERNNRPARMVDIKQLQAEVSRLADAISEEKAELAKLAQVSADREAPKHGWHLYPGTK